ncbi:MAG: endopeptidase La [Ruminococcaceae bacterium]|nr:endopeptidase La [Oscillospiraceae bacterium]
MKILPVLPLRGLVLYPKMILHFDVSRGVSKAALERAMKNGREIFVVCQKDIKVKNPTVDDLYSIGVIASVKQVMKLPNSDLERVVVEGMCRAMLGSFAVGGKCITAQVTPIEEMRVSGFSNEYEAAVVRQGKAAFEAYAATISKLSSNIVMDILSAEKADELADVIAINAPFSWEKHQEILEIINPVKRLERLLVILEEETNLNLIEQKIKDMVQENIDQNQKEYYLREQLRAISDELGEGEDPGSELEEYLQKIKAIGFAEDIESKLVKEAQKLAKMASSSQDAYVVRNYLDTVLSLPWNTYSKDNLNIKKARKVLDRDHYGIQKVKDRVLELIAVRQIKPDISGQIICLVGPPGVGKTSIAKSLAEAMGRKYVRISLGGVHDEAEIRGHRRTYIGAMQGKIISAIKTAGTSNPLMLFDEIDKLGSDYKGDPSSAMLEVLDSEQNNAFMDNFIDIPYDLSKVFFITTANDASSIPEPLYDRMEVIELSSYTQEEKFQIAKKHLVKKELARHGLSAKQVHISDDVIKMLIDHYTSEAGVRELERTIGTLMRKAAAEIVENGKSRVSFTLKNIQSYLGTPKYKKEQLLTTDSVGIVNGLAWTSVGGKILRVEVNVLEGSGKVEFTGSLGDVMKESCSAAVSFIRSISGQYAIEKDFYKTKDIHIHFPAGATPKDGPSAGIAIATAVLSALSNAPVKRDIAMTGEISLKGRVLPIGGLREKAMGAYLAGVRKVLIPADNVPDLDDVDDIVKANLEFVSVESLYEVFEQAFADIPMKEEKKTPVIPAKTGKRTEIRQ